MGVQYDTLPPSPFFSFFFFSGKVDLRREIRRHLTVSANWNKHDEVLKVRIHFKGDVFFGFAVVDAKAPY